MRIGGLRPPVLPGASQDLWGRVPDQDSTFGFDELGVFGMKERSEGTVAGRKPTPLHMVPLPLRAEAGGGRPAVAAPVDLAAIAPTAPLPRAADCAEEDVSVAEQCQPAPEPKASESGQSGQIPNPAGDGDFAPGQGEEARPSRPARARQSDPAYGLVAATDDGKVSIAVKAPPLDADGRALLRRLLRQILSERRLGLADFHLNGVPLGADFLSMTGGSHGPRAR